MALTACEDNVTLREWAPLTDLFQKLPTKTHTSIFNNDLKLTCVDVIQEFIVLGTNCGVVYCYDRKKKDLQRLRCENEKSSITVVKIVSTVEFMLACGNKDGNISIFQIPKTPPENLPESLRPKNKQVERYSVSEMHKGPISALEWSKNGMKLFSGDGNGLVVLTEIDFYMHLCKSVEILNEAYEVVQLSYSIPNQQLLISTMYRSIVCQKQEKWKVCQVGKKDRKVLGKFGGIFYQNSVRPTDLVLYCSRPGLRLWVSDVKGAVQKTLLFKDILNREFPEVPILNPLSSNLKRLKPNKEPSFGVILPFGEELLVTYNNDVVYVLNIKEMKIVATVSHLRGILNVSVTKDEIFILEGERSLIRVGFSPEYMENENQLPTHTGGFIPLNSVKDLTNKIQSANIIPALPTLHEPPKPKEEIIITSAEEAREAPITLTFLNKYKSCEQTYTDKVYENYKRLEIFNKISEQDFDDTILFKHTKHKKKTNDMGASMCSSMSSNSSSEDNVVNKSIVMEVSTVGLMPDLRSPESIKNDIVEKEKILADLLNFDKVNIDLTKLDSKDGFDLNGDTLDSEKCDEKVEKERVRLDINGDQIRLLSLDDENAKLGNSVSDKVGLRVEISSIYDKINTDENEKEKMSTSCDNIPINNIISSDISNAKMSDPCDKVKLVSLEINNKQDLRMINNDELDSSDKSILNNYKMLNNDQICVKEINSIQVDKKIESKSYPENEKKINHNKTNIINDEKPYNKKSMNDETNDRKTIASNHKIISSDTNKATDDLRESRSTSNNTPTLNNCDANNFPVCKKIPDNWMVYDLSVDDAAVDVSLSDWEIL